MKNRSTFSLIGDRYLDTQHDDKYIQSLESELKCRGVVGIKRAVYEYIGASSFWWNIIWWEWVDLNEKDVVFGWCLNLLVFGVISAVIGFLFHLVFDSYTLGLVFAAFTFFVLHVATTMFGFNLRSGTRMKN